MKFYELNKLVLNTHRNRISYVSNFLCETNKFCQRFLNYAFGFSNIKSLPNSALTTYYNKKNCYTGFSTTFIVTNDHALLVKKSYLFCRKLYFKLLHFELLHNCAFGFSNIKSLPDSAQHCISYRNQSFDLHCKSNDWFLYEMLRRVEMG